MCIFHLWGRVLIPSRLNILNFNFFLKITVRFHQCGKDTSIRCNCGIALQFKDDPIYVAFIDKCQQNSNEMCDKKTKNLFQEESCKEYSLNSVDQAFNQSFWNDPIRNKSGNAWLDCAKYGENEFFVS